MNDLQIALMRENENREPEISREMLTSLNW
jgi:hypothetical protein